MTRLKFILYGAEASPHPPLSMAESIRFAARRKLHSYRDVTHFRHGDLSHLDYRNYEGRDVVNLGDVAIYQSTAALIKHALPEANILPMNWGKLSQYSFKNEDRHKTMLIFNGSGYFHISADGRLTKRIKDDLDALRRHAIPAFFFGVGLNRPGQTDLDAPVSLHPEDAAIVSELLDYAQAISVRDAGTQAALAPLTSKPVHLTGDPALHYFHAMGIQTSSATIHPANAPPVIGVNVSFHGKNSNDLLKKNLEGYCAVLLRLQKETGAEFRYFIHYATSNIVPKLLAQRGIHVKKVPTGTQGAGAGETADLPLMAREYAKLDLHIGGMLHSCILATSAGTPCLALAYDIKHQGFFDLMGLPENCLSAANFDSDELYSRAMDLLANPAPVRTHIALRRDELQVVTQKFIQNLHSFL